MRIAFARVGNAQPLYAVGDVIGCSTVDEVVKVVREAFPHVTKSRIKAACQQARKDGSVELDESF